MNDLPLQGVPPAPNPPAPPAPRAPEAAEIPPAPAPTALVTAPEVAPAAAQPAAPPVPETPATDPVLPPEWPFKGFNGAQPWQAVNPPEITHSERMITSGTAGPEVVRLAGLLEALGYPTSISQGGNPHAIYDAEVASAVRSFCAEYGVQEDPKIVAAMTADVVGPWLWEALIRAAHKAGGN